MEKTLMDFKDARKYLKVAKSTLYNLLRAQKIPASKVGRQWRFRRGRLDKWLEDQENMRLKLK